MSGSHLPGRAAARIRQRVPGRNRLLLQAPQHPHRIFICNRHGASAGSTVRPPVPNTRVVTGYRPILIYDVKLSIYLRIF